MSNSKQPKVEEKKDERSLTHYIVGAIFYLVGFVLFQYNCLAVLQDYSDDLYVWLTILGACFLITGGMIVKPPQKEAESPKTRDDANWRTVQPASFKKIADAVVKSVKLSKKSSGLSCGCGCGLYGLYFCLLFVAIINDENNLSTLSIACSMIGGGLLIIAFCGRTSLKPYVPPLLAKKIDSFIKLKEKIATAKTPDVTVHDQICFDHDLHGLEIPTDMKFTYSIKNAPEDFVTAQTVLNLNSVQSREYEYLYSVFVLKYGKSMPSKEFIKQKLSGGINMEKECSRDGDYYIIVYKLDSGYYTNERKMGEIFLDTLETLQALSDKNAKS